MALTLLATNNAESTLASAISATDTSLIVSAGTGAEFPDAVAGESYFKLTLTDAATGSQVEIVNVTAKAGDIFTIERAQEGTLARAWAANDMVANMMTADTLNVIADFAKQASDSAEEAQGYALSASEFGDNKSTFADTATGLAATTSGQYFRVPQGAGNVLAFRYYKNNSGVAQEVAEYPGQGSITNTIREFPTLAAAQADTDAGNIQVGAICWVLNSSDNTLADEYANISGTLTATGRSIPSQSSINNHFTEQPRSAVALDFVGSNGRRASLCIAKSGRFITTGDGVDVADTISNIGKTIKLEASSIKYSFKITDASGRVACGLGLDGHPIIAGQRIEAYIPQIAWSNIPNSFSKKIDTDTTQLVAWGDSLTESTGGATSYPSQLATLLGRTVLNRGRGGQDVTRIIARQGGAAISCSVDGNSIPASGAVNVTPDIQALTTASTAPTLSGWLANIYGTLSLNQSTGQYSFTRSSSGATQACWPGSAFVVDTSLTDYMLPIFWCGRNNFNYVVPDLTAMVQKVFDYIQRGVSYLKPANSKFIIMGVISGNNSFEYVGTDNYNAKRQLVSLLQQKYPGNFIDIDTILVNSYNPSIPQDVTDFNNGIVPSSLRNSGDTQHLNTAGYAIVANECYKLITSRGW
ncbi:TPA: hypothetical protein ACSRG1_000426 [Klebsiella pneumoniae]